MRKFVIAAVAIAAVSSLSACAGDWVGKGKGKAPPPEPAPVSEPAPVYK